MQEVKGRVTYVTTTMVYGDLGTRSGLVEGDTVYVDGATAPLATLRVRHLSSKSFSAEVLEKHATILEGQPVRARVRVPQPPPRPVLAPDSSAVPDVRAGTARPRHSAAGTADQGGDASSPPGGRIRGRLSLQYYALHSSASAGLAFSQPGAVLSFTADQLFALPLEFSYYSNHRYDARGDDLRAGTGQARLRHRFYQFALKYGEANATITGILGRFIPYQVGGIGTVDGVMLAAQSGRFEGGILAGAQPGYRDSELNLNDQKFALYLGYTQGERAWQLRSNVAFAQTYRDGAVDRGYLYLVNNLSLSGTVTLYQNATLDLYDADHGEGRSRPHLTDLYLSGNWRPSRGLSVTAAFADRRSVYFLRSFASMPDSLFNPSRMRNCQLSTGINIPGGMYASLSASLRTQEQDDNASTAYSARYSVTDLFSSGSNLSLLGTFADNIYNTARSMGVEANRDILDGLHAALRVLQYRFVYTIHDRVLDRLSAAVDLYYRLGGVWFLSLNYERYWEGGIGSDRMYTELRMRLR